MRLLITLCLLLLTSLDAQAQQAPATPQEIQPVAEPSQVQPAQEPAAVRESPTVPASGAVSPAPDASMPAQDATTAPQPDGAAPPAGDLPADASPAGDETTTLPGAHGINLSPWGMFANADMVVKAVMVGLVFASLVSWTAFLAKALELYAARRRLGKGAARLAKMPGLPEAAHAFRNTKGDLGEIVRGTERELVLSDGAIVPSGVKERVASRIARIEAGAARRLSRGTGVLATIGATSPFVGLFGTVWGIMNSFIGIAESQTTNLAVVAPGIAEALLATALGLVAAIPAVVFYNLYARWLSTYRALLSDAAAETMRLLGRHLDRLPGRSLALAAE